MLILPIEEASPGMKLAMNVPHPDQPDQDLLKAGYVLEEKVLKRMRELGVSYIYVDYPALDDLDKYLGPTLSPERQVLYNQIKNTIAAVQKTAKPTVAFPDYYAATRDFVLTLLQQGLHPVYMDQLSAKLGPDAVSHSVAVAHLCLTLGIKLERYLIDQRSRLPAHHAREVVNLGVGAMLHDIGKVKLPEHLQKYDGLHLPESDADRSEWETHVQRGYEMIHDGIEPSATTVVMHHHQHFDGSGFPSRENKDKSITRQEGYKIHVYARIALAADIYDHLTCDEHGVRRPNVEILHLMRTQHGAWLDPHVLQTMPMVVPPFPPASKVKLSDGSTAVVTAFDPDNPYRPTVKRMKADGWELESEPVDLAVDGAPLIEIANGVRVSAMIPPSPKRTAASHGQAAHSTAAQHAGEAVV